MWASATDAVLTITARSPKPAYSYTLSAESRTSLARVAPSQNRLANGRPDGHLGHRSIAVASLESWSEGLACRLLAQCKARNREVVVASSMELVNPPEGFGAVYPDGAIVETDVGFGSLKSTHCAFVPAVRNYHSQVFSCVAGLMSAAEITPFDPVRRILVVVLHELQRIKHQRWNGVLSSGSQSSSGSGSGTSLAPFRQSE